jgi:ergothioneine biosynthesis protein EgtB
MQKIAVEIPEMKFTTRYARVREQTEHLCSTLSAEDCMVQSMPEASPVKWHLAHTTWFFETFLLAPHVKDYQPQDPDYRYLFNSYYNAIGERPLRQVRGTFSRPSFTQVREYRRHVDAAMLKLLEHPSAKIAELATIGLNHEQQHQELIVTDAKHALWSNPLRPAFRPKECAAQTEAAPLQWTDFPGGIQTIGYGGKGFCFDNELPRHDVLLQPFVLACRLVTNAEFLEFMRDGGYRRPELWLSDGWDTARAQDWNAPLYWEEQEGSWRYYTATGMRSVEEDAAVPVAHVSYYEADAYARWYGARLATEGEWETAAQQLVTAAPASDEEKQTETSPPRDGGSVTDDMHGNFLESGNFHPCSSSDSSQLLGDLWEWTQSAYLPYPGYQAAEGALGEYNGKFMCNQFVLRGGSCVTPRSHIRVSYRNFFPPAARWQFSGIRLAK